MAVDDTRWPLPPDESDEDMAHWRLHPGTWIAYVRAMGEFRVQVELPGCDDDEDSWAFTAPMGDSLAGVALASLCEQRRLQSAGSSAGPSQPFSEEEAACASDGTADARGSQGAEAHVGAEPSEAEPSEATNGYPATDGLSIRQVTEASAVATVWPVHRCGMTIEHNPHRNYYDTIERHTERFDDEDWASPEERSKSIANDELWIIQWYPDTPIGSYVVAASTFEACIAEALR